MNLPTFCWAQDEVLAEEKRPIEKALLEGDFKTFKSLFYRTYAVIDTSSIEKREVYLSDLFAYTEVLCLEKKHDSAIVFLKNLLNMKEFESFIEIIGSVAFWNVKKNSEFIKLADISYEKLLRKYAEYKKPKLRIQLLSMGMTDQSNLYYNSKDTLTLNRIIKNLVDSLAVIFNENGYPKSIEVGKDASIIPVLILLHANIETQLKYKDFILNSAKRGYIHGGIAGVLIDKIQVHQKQTQLYGSQYRIVGKDKQIVYYPIEDSLNLERRRNEMGFTISFENEKRIREMEYESHSKKKNRVKYSSQKKKRSEKNFTKLKPKDILFDDDFSLDDYDKFPEKWKIVQDCYSPYPVAYENSDKWYVTFDSNNTAVESVTSILDITPKNIVDLRQIDTLCINFDFVLHAFYSRIKVQFALNNDSVFCERSLQVDSCGRIIMYNPYNILRYTTKCIDQFDHKHWHHFSLLLKKKVLQCFIDGEKVLQIEDCGFSPSKFALGCFGSVKFKNVVVSKTSEIDSIRISNIYFDFDNSEVSEEYKKVVYQLAGSLKKNPSLKIEIKGYADTDGSDTYNLNLSERRALEIKRLLINKGINENRISTKGYGTTNSNPNSIPPSDKSNNRRAVIIVK